MCTSGHAHYKSVQQNLLAELFATAYLVIRPCWSDNRITPPRGVWVTNVTCSVEQQRARSKKMERLVKLLDKERKGADFLLSQMMPMELALKLHKTRSLEEICDVSRVLQRMREWLNG